MLVRFFKRRSQTGDSVPGLAAKSIDVSSKSFTSARDLAESFGAPVFEPTWWPEDAGTVLYELDTSPSGAKYRIGSTHTGGTPICVLGRPHNPRRNLPTGDWSPIPELEAVGGLISTSGANVRGVVHQEHQTLHLIGYASEAELIRAVKSFQRVPAASD